MLQSIPDCLGTPDLEVAALWVAKVRDPSPLRPSASPPGPSPLTGSQEGLRLFPSNRRIYRGSPPPSSPAAAPLFRADVEALHRDPAIWGPDAAHFRPERWARQPTPLEARAYVPFGLRPHMCPAHKGFALRLVALLVAVLGAQMGRGRAVVSFGEGGGKGDLPTGRRDMEGWKVVC